MSGEAERPTVVVLTPEQLAELVEGAVRRVLAAGRSDDDWIGAEEVARILGVERGTVPTLVRRDGLPCYRPGKGYTFRRSEVVAWLEERAQGRRSHSARHGRTLRVLKGKEG